MAAHIPVVSRILGALALFAVLAPSVPVHAFCPHGARAGAEPVAGDHSDAPMSHHGEAPANPGSAVPTAAAPCHGPVSQPESHEATGAEAAPCCGDEAMTAVCCVHEAPAPVVLARTAPVPRPAHVAPAARSDSDATTTERPGALDSVSFAGDLPPPPRHRYRDLSVFLL